MPGLPSRVAALVRAPAVPTQGGRSRLSPLASAFALVAVLVYGFGLSVWPELAKPGNPAGGTAAVVTSFSIAKDLSTATVGLTGAGGATFIGPSGSVEVDGLGVLRIPLDFSGATAPTTITLTSASDPADVLQVNYYPAQYYQSIGLKSAGVIDLYTTLPRANNTSRKEDTSPPVQAATTSQASPAAADSAGQAAWMFVHALFGTAAEDESLDEQIRQLYLQFDAQNDPEVGTVCDRSMSGIDMLSAVSVHTCYVTCTGYALITNAFLRSMETPSRYISLGGTYSYLPNGVLVESSESHDTADLWANGQWQWLDPTLRVLRATGAGGLTLTLDGLMSALTGQSSRSALTFTRLDPATGHWQTLSWDNEDAAFRQYISAYLSADKIMLAG